METLAQILDSLGINQTLFLQLIIFVVMYVILSRVLFKPYLEAYTERQARTTGNEEHADRIINETAELETVYQKKARSLNTEHKAIYDKSRSEALHQHDEMVSEARAKAQVILDKSRETIEEQTKAARKDLADEAPAVSREIVVSLAGKELLQ